MSRGHVLVTGGAGFIGSHLVDRLLGRGFEVTVLDCLVPQVHADAPKDADGWPTYLNPAARRIRGNLLDADVVQRSLQGITHLAHLAAYVGVGQSMTNIADYTMNNTQATAVLLQVLSRGEHTVERMAVASSMSIYGEGAYRSPEGDGMVAPPLREREQLQARQWEVRLREAELEPMATPETKPLQPASIYAVNKRDHEEMFLAVGRALDIPTVALRLFNTYGPRQALSNPYTGVAAIFISRLLNGQAPMIFEDGNQRRDFVHVSDVARAFSTVLESGDRVWDVFNVGTGRPVTISGVAFILARLLRKNIAPEILSRYRVGDIRHCYADPGKLAMAFDFRTEVAFEAGMAELIEWVDQTQRPIDRSEASLAELRASRLVV